MMLDLDQWEARFAACVAANCTAADPAHDLAHFRRVVANAKRLTAAEGGRPEITVAAAWLHDFVLVPKDSPLRAQASLIAADAALQWLSEQDYPDEFLRPVHHAVHAHSFTARVEPRTLEAAIVQDADRLDAIGAVGLARCLMLGGVMGRPLYDDDEPFPTARAADDRRSTIDHFYTKLLGLAATMRTASGRREARRRTEFLRQFLLRLADEIGHPDPHGVVPPPASD